MSTGNFVLVAVCYLSLFGCINDTDICVGLQYELLIEDLPDDIDELTIDVEFGSLSIMATCGDPAAGSKATCGGSQGEWVVSSGFSTEERSAWLQLDDHERQSSTVPPEISVTLSSPSDVDYNAQRTFTPDIQRMHDCESALDVWYLGLD